MGSASSMLTQYDIEEVQEHCRYLFSQQEIVALYNRFCQLDRSAKGFISADEFLSIPEFSLNPLSQRVLKMVDGLNFKDFVAFLSAFSPQATIQQKIEFIFKVYDVDGKGRVSFKDLLEVLRNLTGSFMSEEQREKVLTQVLEEAGYTRNSALLLDDFLKIKRLKGQQLSIPTQDRGNIKLLICRQCKYPWISCRKRARLSPVIKPKGEIPSIARDLIKEI